MTLAPLPTRRKYGLLPPPTRLRPPPAPSPPLCRNLACPHGDRVYFSVLFFILGRRGAGGLVEQDLCLFAILLCRPHLRFCYVSESPALGRRLQYPVASFGSVEPVVQRRLSFNIFLFLFFMNLFLNLSEDCYRADLSMTTMCVGARGGGCLCGRACVRAYVGACVRGRVREQWRERRIREGENGRMRERGRKTGRWGERQRECDGERD